MIVISINDSDSNNDSNSNNDSKLIIIMIIISENYSKFDSINNNI